MAMWEMNVGNAAKRRFLETKLHVTQVCAGYQMIIEMHAEARLLSPETEKPGPQRVALSSAVVKLEFADGTTLDLGHAQGYPRESIRLEADASALLRFHLPPLSPAAMTRLERARAGGRFKLRLECWGTVFAPHGGQLFEASAFGTWSIEVNRDAWTDELERAGFAQTVVVEVQLPTNPTDDEKIALDHLLTAVRKRAAGQDGDAMVACRSAIDALAKSRVGARAPEKVVAFLKDHARSLTMAERLAAVRVALSLYLAPAAHDGTTPDGAVMSREDSDFALAVSSALVKVSRARRPAPIIEADPTAES